MLSLTSSTNTIGNAAFRRLPFIANSIAAIGEESEPQNIGPGGWVLFQ
jgi:hypothetical protein